MFKKSIFLIIFLWSFTTYAQDYHKLIEGNDTINVLLKVSRKNGKYNISFKKPYEATWHPIDANNADIALIPDQKQYMSLKLPDTVGKVWVECLFDGTYKLLRYNNLYYIAEPDNIIKLDYVSERIYTAEADNTIKYNRNRKHYFKGILIVIFKDKIDFDFNSLSYSPQSLALPLIKYHQNYKLPYHDYISYAPVNIGYDVNAGVAYGTYTIYPRLAMYHSIKNISPYVGANMSIGFPDISKRINISLGLNAEYININDLFVESRGSETYYDEILYKGFNISTPVMLKYDVIQRQSIFVQLSTGIRPSKVFTSTSELKIQTLRNNIVETDLEKIKVPDLPKIFHHSEIVLKCPAITNNFSLGASYSYNLKKIPIFPESLMLYLDNRLSAFVRYTIK